MKHTTDVKNREPAKNRQLLLDFIVEYMTESGGIPPTTARMCEALDCSKPTVYHHRNKLAIDGFIEIVDGKVSIPNAVSSGIYHLPVNANGQPELSEHDLVLADESIKGLSIQTIFDIRVVELGEMVNFKSGKTAVVTDNDSYKLRAIELGFSVYTIKQVELQMEVK